MVPPTISVPFSASVVLSSTWMMLPVAVALVSLSLSSVAPAVSSVPLLVIAPSAAFETPWIVALPVSLTVLSSSMLDLSVMVVPDTVTLSSVSLASTVTAPLLSVAPPSILLAPVTSMVPLSVIVPPLIVVPFNVSVAFESTAMAPLVLSTLSRTLSVPPETSIPPVFVMVPEVLKSPPFAKNIVPEFFSEL